MAYIVSPALGMNLADPTTIQNFETPVVNNNFLALENGIVADRVRLVALEALPPALATPTLYARGQVADFLVVDPAALDAVTTASIGDKAWMTTPGTGIDPITWTAVADAGADLDWRNESDILVADTKAHLDTFIAAVAATTDLRFHIGTLVFVTGTGILYRITSAVGALHVHQSGLVPIKPGSVAGTGVTLGADGAVSIAAASTTTASINNCFDATFDHYLVIVKGALTAAQFNFRMRAAGVDDAGASAYAGQSLSGVSSTASASTSAASPQASITLSGQTDHRAIVDIFNPADAEATYLLSRSIASTTTTLVTGMQAWKQIATTAQDGFSLIAGSGNLGATIVRIFGYNDN